MASHRFFVVAAACAVAAPAARAGDRFQHDARVALDAKLTDRSRAPTAHPGDAGGPGVTAPGDMLGALAELGPIQEDQAQLMRGLVHDTPDSEPMEKAEYLFRLGEIYAKQQRTHRLLAAQASIGKDRNDAERTRQQALATAAFGDAVQVLGSLVNTEAYRAYPHRDLALFFLGYTLQQADRMADARVAFDKLLKDHPKSKYVAEAHLAFADWYFDTNRLADAEAAYRKVLEFPRASVYWYALYKLGWVALDLGKPVEALDTFYQVAKGTERDADRAELHRSARKDFVRAYAETGRADKALPAFQRVDGAHAYDMLEVLGDLYFNAGKADKAIAVYRQLLVAQPASSRVCVWEHGVTRAMMTAGTPDDQIAEIERLAKLYVHLRDAKRFATAGDADECRDATAELTGQLARAYHQEAARTKQPATFARADHLYRAYLATFPAAPDVADTRYFRAELLWAKAELEPNARLATEQWQEAADAFAVALDGGGLSAKLVPVAADAAMLARMKSLAIDPTRHAAPVTDAAYATVPAPRPLPAQERALLGAFDGYLRWVTDGGDDERVYVQFQKGVLLRRFDHHAEAIAVFEDVIAKHGQHEVAETAAQLALDSYNRLHRYPEMLALADRLAADRTFVHDKPDLAKTIGVLHKQSVRHAAEELEKTKQPAKLVACGNQYLGLYNADPMAADGDELLYNAGVCFEEGHSLSAAQLMYTNLQKLYPKSALAAKSLARLGNAYASTAFYREAAEKLEEYAAKYAGETDARAALSDAVQFRKGIGDDRRAIDDTRLYVAKFGAKDPARAAAAFWSLGAIYEKQGDLPAVAAHYRAYAERYGAIDPARTAVAWAKAGLAMWEHACPVKPVDGACVKVVKETSRNTCGDASKVALVAIPRAAGEVGRAMAALDRALAYGGAGTPELVFHQASAKLAKLDRDFETYLAMPIPAGLDFDKRSPAIAQQSHARFDRWFAGKRARLLALHAGYAAVIGMHDGATAIAAAARMGQLAQGFALQLYRAEIPADLRRGPYAEDASAAYCDTLAEIATPLETDALASYQGCLTTSTKLGWFSPYSRLCERELGALEPEQWPTTSELRAAPDQVSLLLAVEAPALTIDR